MQGRNFWVSGTLLAFFEDCLGISYQRFFCLVLKIFNEQNFGICIVLQQSYGIIGLLKMHFQKINT